MIFGSPPMRWVFYAYGFFVAFVKREKNRRNAKGVGVEFYPCQQAGLPDAVGQFVPNCGVSPQPASKT
jgi:hypothetical protein